MTREQSSGPPPRFTSHAGDEKGDRHSPERAEEKPFVFVVQFIAPNRPESEEDKGDGGGKLPDIQVSNEGSKLRGIYPERFTRCCR
jgi:hypothetical protein